MRRLLAILGSGVFLVIAPGIVAGYVPWRICRWHVEAPLLGISLVRLVGGLLIAAGLTVLLDSFARFALQGLGTPAPIFPTRHLIVSGLYRYVRNPMYVAVVSLVLGQGLFFGSVRVLEYGFAVWVAFHLFVRVYEEPTLQKTYGQEYEEFRANVPRWFPRLQPWRRLPIRARRNHVHSTPILTVQTLDFSEVDSLQKARALYSAGKLELLYLFPLEFGGKEIPENTLYVPLGIAGIKQRIDGQIRDLLNQGKVRSYAAQPEYKGNSFIPSKIKITTDLEKSGGFNPVIDIW